jgi:hypothetical protein
MRPVFSVRPRVRRLLGGLLAGLLFVGLGAGAVLADASGHCTGAPGGSGAHDPGHHGTKQPAGHRLLPAAPDCSHCASASCELLSPCGLHGFTAVPVEAGVPRLEAAWSRVDAVAPAELRSTAFQPPTPPPQLTL